VRAQAAAQGRPVRPVQSLRPEKARGEPVWAKQSLRAQEEKTRVSDGGSVHAQRIVAIMSRYAQMQSSVALAALAGARSLSAWAHYPRHDVVDATHGTQFYYHSHARVRATANEHGHFHVFVRARGRVGFHHVVGISLTDHGLPVELFLTNQWVTGERWVPTTDLAPLITRFDCVTAGRLAPIAHWITSMVHLYRPEILALHAKRDAWFARPYARGLSQSERLTDRRHEVIARKSIRLAERLAASY